MRCSILSGYVTVVLVNSVGRIENILSTNQLTSCNFEAIVRLILSLLLFLILRLTVT